MGYVVAGDSSAKVSFAAPGDTDLNGSVDVFDLVSVNSSGKYGTGAAAVWGAARVRRAVARVVQDGPPRGLRGGRLGR